MAIVATLSAVLTAVLPAASGLILGQPPRPSAAVGLAIWLAITLVSRQSGTARPRLC